MDDIHLTVTPAQFALLCSALGFFDGCIERMTHEEAHTAINESELDSFFENKNEVSAGIKGMHKNIMTQLENEYPNGT
jgi:hypothetical protein